MDDEHLPEMSRAVSDHHPARTGLGVLAVDVSEAPCGVLGGQLEDRGTHAGADGWSSRAGGGGFQNSAVGVDLRFEAARSYMLPGFGRQLVASTGCKGADQVP